MFLSVPSWCPHVPDQLHLYQMSGRTAGGLAGVQTQPLLAVSGAPPPLWAFPACFWAPLPEGSRGPWGNALPAWKPRRLCLARTPHGAPRKPTCSCSPLTSPLRPPLGETHRLSPSCHPPPPPAQNRSLACPSGERGWSRSWGRACWQGRHVLAMSSARPPVWGEPGRNVGCLGPSVCSDFLGQPATLLPAQCPQVRDQTVSGLMPLGPSSCGVRQVSGIPGCSIGQ